MINGDIDQKDVTVPKTTAKKDKTTKTRTRASAKKTIEGLRNDENKPLGNEDNTKDNKMGKRLVGPLRVPKVCNFLPAKIILII